MKYMTRKMNYQMLGLILFFMGTALTAQEVVTGENVAVTQTESGQVRGYIHNGIFTYKGIPYAQAERFEAPTKAKAWEGVRSSTTYGPVAPLMTPTTVVQDEPEFVFDHDWGYTNEDCLRINIWTPSIDLTKKRPVLFWIHGGGYTAGSSQELPSYDGENLSKKGDVVVVSINHRLNILGFLDLSAYGDKYKHSANNSILDMVAALEWVKTNIAKFWGRPQQCHHFRSIGRRGQSEHLDGHAQGKGSVPQGSEPERVVPYRHVGKKRDPGHCGRSAFQLGAYGQPGRQHSKDAIRGLERGW